MQDFHALHSVNIHYPPNNYMDDATRKSVIADLPGLRLAKQITLARQTQPGATSAMFGPQTNRLNLRLHNKVRCRGSRTAPPSSRHTGKLHDRSQRVRRAKYMMRRVADGGAIADGPWQPGA